MQPKLNLKFILLISGIIFSLSSFSQNDSLAFGDKKKIDDALKGEIYALPDTSSMLPDFTKLKPLGTLYTQKIDVSPREWTTGFPGVPDRKEWFGIVYTGSFKITKAGTYIFRLLSDDGAKLIIDKKVVVDNNGIHGPSSKLGSVNLDASKHSFRLEYFQGPKTQIALQLFVTYGNETEQIFPGPNFDLSTPSVKAKWKTYLIYAGIAILLIFILWLWARRKKTIPAD